MLKVINNESEWNDILKYFHEMDIYYLPQYTKPFSSTMNSEPLLIYFENNKMKLAYVVEKFDLSDESLFSRFIEKNKYYDISTPYGYGGPLVENYNKKDCDLFYNELTEWAKKNNIVSQFFRFHPIFKNQEYLENFVEIRNLKQTVYINTENEEVIYKNLNDKSRNMIKKAQKNNIHIAIDNSEHSQNIFKKLYFETMQRNKASDYYYFTEEFFDKIFEHLGSISNIFVAKYEDIIISSAIIFEYGDFLHYHLSAANRDYMKFGANNLLLYEVAKYGAKKGYKKFHLGGGIKAEDGLFIFKKSFNKNGLLDYYIGRSIFDLDKYNELLQIRKQVDYSFDINNDFLIAYRA